MGRAEATHSRRRVHRDNTVGARVGNGGKIEKLVPGSDVNAERGADLMECVGELCQKSSVRNTVCVCAAHLVVDAHKMCAVAKRVTSRSFICHSHVLPEFSFRMSAKDKSLHRQTVCKYTMAQRADRLQIKVDTSEAAGLYLVNHRVDEGLGVSK